MSIELLVEAFVGKKAHRFFRELLSVSISTK
jgi:hypothetical protein